MGAKRENGQRGSRALFPGDQKTGDMRAAIQTKNQQTGGGASVPGITNESAKVPMRSLRAMNRGGQGRGAGSKEVLRDVQWGGGFRESFSEWGKGTSSPPHPVPPALKSVSPG